MVADALALVGTGLNADDTRRFNSGGGEVATVLSEDDVMRTLRYKGSEANPVTTHGKQRIHRISWRMVHMVPALFQKQCLLWNRILLEWKLRARKIMTIVFM